MISGTRVLVLVAIMAWASSAAAVPPRELEAREAFATGKYQRALDLFGKLYAETLHPTYLRNIGRCYQYLGDPDRALNSFHNYLRTAKNVTPDERQEVQGFIDEMEALKRKNAALPSPRPPVAVPTPVPEPLALQAPAPEPTRPERGGHWWVWTVGAVVLAGVAATLAATGVFTHTQDALCPADRKCVR
jgi:hypothetical protein